MGWARRGTLRSSLFTSVLQSWRPFIARNPRTQRAHLRPAQAEAVRLKRPLGGEEVEGPIRPGTIVEGEVFPEPIRVVWVESISTSGV